MTKKILLVFAFCVVGGIALVSFFMMRTVSPVTTSTPEQPYFTDSSKTFRFVAPELFTVIEKDTDYTQPWRQGDTTPGTVLVVARSPRDLYPTTNFGDAVFTVGVSADSRAIASCLTQTNGPFAQKSNVVLGGIPYAKITFLDAGAGNYYETTSYRTVHHGQCYAIEYTLHSMNIYNYPPDLGISEYNKQEVTAFMDDIVESFQFIDAR